MSPPVLLPIIPHNVTTYDCAGLFQLLFKKPPGASAIPMLPGFVSYFLLQKDEAKQGWRATRDKDKTLHSLMLISYDYVHFATF